MTTALIVAFTYWLVYWIDESFSWQALVRPIVAGPIFGLVLGDVKTGIILGGMLEAIYMGVVSIGGGAPADAYVATALVVTYVIQGGISLEAGVALSFPIGTLARNINTLVLPMHAYLIRWFEKFAAAGDYKSYSFLQQIYRIVFSRLFHTIVIFLGVWLGGDAVVSFFNVLPPYILKGLTVAGALFPAVGLGILLTMIYKKELTGFMIIGFVLVAYLGIGTMGIALIAGATALIFYFIDAEKKANASSSKGEELF
ncbi:MAG: PTS sugar transporter subunit IIC [Erysipelotrichaceae bacterium]|nr:PTS sugar transporter subunit IIC [Erysipelotrichaceae bacterium]